MFINDQQASKTSDLKVFWCVRLEAIRYDMSRTTISLRNSLSNYVLDCAAAALWIYLTYSLPSTYKKSL